MNESRMDQLDKVEDFLFGGSLVVNLMKQLDDIANSSKNEQSATKEAKHDKDFSPPPVNVDEFIVADRDANTRKSKSFQSDPTLRAENVDQFAFVNQIDCNKEERSKYYRERVLIAHNFRTLGNHEYRHCNFKEAIFYYTKGLESIHDTPVLYCNRALCHAKMGNYQLALMDLELVVTKYDPNSVRGWMYKAACFFRLGDDKSFKSSISCARLRNPDEQKFIDAFIKRIPSDF